MKNGCGWICYTSDYFRAPDLVKRWNWAWPSCILSFLLPYFMELWIWPLLRHLDKIISKILKIRIIRICTGKSAHFVGVTEFVASNHWCHLSVPSCHSAVRDVAESFMGAGPHPSASVCDGPALVIYLRINQRILRIPDGFFLSGSGSRRRPVRRWRFARSDRANVTLFVFWRHYVTRQRL